MGGAAVQECESDQGSSLVPEDTTHAKSSTEADAGPAVPRRAAGDPAGRWEARDHPVTPAMIHALIPLGLKAVEDALVRK